LSRGPGRWQRHLLLAAGNTCVVTVASVVRSVTPAPGRNDYAAAQRAARRLAAAGDICVLYIHACARCGQVQDREAPEPCCAAVKAMLAICQPQRRALVQHPAPPPGGTAPAWMESVTVTLPRPSPGELPAASTGDVLSLTLQRYCEQLLSGRVAVSARDVAILMRLEREFRRDAERDRLAVARLTFRARRLVAQLAHRAWRWPTPDETAAWVTELQQIAPGRADLLAEAAGVLLGAAEGTLDEPRAYAAAELCRAAGADQALIRQWTEEGRRRAQAVFGRQAARVALDAASRAAG
jgi:hypothetical protein